MAPESSASAEVCVDSDAGSVALRFSGMGAHDFSAVVSHIGFNLRGSISKLRADHPNTVLHLRPFPTCTPAVLAERLHGTLIVMYDDLKVTLTAGHLEEAFVPLRSRQLITV